MKYNPKEIKNGCFAILLIKIIGNNFSNEKNITLGKSRKAQNK